MESSYSVSVFAELEGSNTDSTTGPVFKTSPPPPELLIDEITSTSMKLSRHEFIIKLYISSIKDTPSLRSDMMRASLRLFQQSLSILQVLRSSLFIYFHEVWLSSTFSHSKDQFRSNNHKSKVSIGRNFDIEDKNFKSRLKIMVVSLRFMTVHDKL